MSPLLSSLRGIIERTFDLDTGVGDISPFIVGDAGFARHYWGRPTVRSVGSGAAGAWADPIGARTLVRQEGGELKLAIYYPDRLIENLERNDPGRSLSAGNVDDFATLVEELDHFLTIADRHRAGAEVSLLELELHANVTKELVLAFFVARHRGAARLGSAEHAWIRHHLFGKVDYDEEDRAVQVRYRDAAALAVRYLDHLRTMPLGERAAELRRFHRRTHHQKLAGITRL